MRPHGWRHSSPRPCSFSGCGTAIATPSVADFEARSAFFTVLDRIGINEARPCLQRRSARPRTAPLEAAPGEADDERRGPRAHAEALHFERAVLAAILPLRMDARMPLVLRDVEDLSTGEAAAMTGLGEAARKSRLHRARLAGRATVERPVASEEER